jgi:hypothetical protein
MTYDINKVTFFNYDRGINAGPMYGEFFRLHNDPLPIDRITSDCAYLRNNYKRDDQTDEKLYALGKEVYDTIIIPWVIKNERRIKRVAEGGGTAVCIDSHELFMNEYNYLTFYLSKSPDPRFVPLYPGWVVYKFSDQPFVISALKNLILM